MREVLDDRKAEALRVQRAFVEKSHRTVFEAKSRKKRASKERHLAEREEKSAIGEAAKLARAERKEQTKATVRREEQEAREYTAKVRHETRPEVRHEASQHFVKQRKALADAIRERSEAEKAALTQKREAYLDAATKRRDVQRALLDHARTSRDALEEQRKHDAAQVRAESSAALQRKQETEQRLRQTTRELHDEMKRHEDESALPEAEAKQSSWLGWMLA